MNEITLSSTEFKALASETRTGIVKLLHERNHTLSEISKKMNLAAPTVKQHLALLEKAGIVECIDEGRKWKYYALTSKGKRILEPEQGSIFVVLGLVVLGMAVAIFALLSRITVSTNYLGKEGFPALETQAVVKAGANALPPEMQAMQSETLLLGAITTIIIVFALLCTIFLWKAFRRR